MGRLNGVHDLIAGPSLPSRPRMYSLVGSAVVEQIETDEFHALHLQIDKRAANAAACGRKRSGTGNQAGSFCGRISRSPVGTPIHPGQSPRLNGSLTASAKSLVILHLSLKSIRTILRIGRKEVRHRFSAGLYGIPIFCFRLITGEKQQERRAE